eukprot:COSAG06_NODE_871_length_11856_cov_6.434039_2_plen_91_part_00
MDLGNGDHRSVVIAPRDYRELRLPFAARAVCCSVWVGAITVDAEQTDMHWMWTYNPFLPSRSPQLLLIFVGAWRVVLVVRWTATCIAFSQ